MSAPVALQTITLDAPKSPKGLLEKRFGKFAKGAVLPAAQVAHSPRRKVADFPEGFLPVKFIEALEQNQLLNSCCRHPENHEIEARKSHPDEQAADIYVFHCACGRKHTRFCVGLGDPRPEWQ